jgi:hypothetical protein
LIKSGFLVLQSGIELSNSARPKGKICDEEITIHRFSWKGLDRREDFSLSAQFRVCFLVQEFLFVPQGKVHDPLLTLPIEFTVENLFPRPEVQLAIRNGYYHLAAHDLALMVSIAVFLAGTVMVIALWVRSLSEYISFIQEAA